jgi:hypothetical protein
MDTIDCYAPNACACKGWRISINYTPSLFWLDFAALFLLSSVNRNQFKPLRRKKKEVTIEQLPVFKFGNRHIL